jgi:hypothetical protein
LWHDHFQVLPGWSPLYAIYFGSWLWLNPDPFFAVTMHRIGIFLTLAFLLYEIMRKMMPPLPAFMGAVWWTVLPVNHDGIYEVHPFAMILPLASVYILTQGDAPKYRATAIGLLMVSTVLLRPEFLIPTLVMVTFSLVWDLGKASGTRDLKTSRLSLLRPYAWAASLAVVCIVLVLSRSSLSWNEFRVKAQEKRKLNMNQLFAFGYSQRHPEWGKNPWTECDALMREQFGSDDIGLSQSFRLNPKAMVEHVSWNVSTLPEGVAIGLFNLRFGIANPDYAPHKRKPWTVLILALGATSILTGGAVLAWKDRRKKLEQERQSGRWPWVGLGALTAGSLSILVLAPPRPAFIYGLTMTLIILCAASLSALSGQWSWGKRLRWTIPVVMLGLVLATPNYWSKQRPFQPVLAQVRALTPYRDAILAGRFPRIAVSGWEDAMPTYLNMDKIWNDNFHNVREVGNSLPPGKTLNDVFAADGTKLVVIADIIDQDKPVQEFEQASLRNGWILECDSIFHGHRVKVYTQQ